MKCLTVILVYRLLTPHLASVVEWYKIDHINDSYRITVLGDCKTFASIADCNGFVETKLRMTGLVFDDLLNSYGHNHNLGDTYNI